MEDQAFIQLVLDFTREMNGLQTSFYPRLTQSRRDKEQIFQQYRAQADGIYNRYLTWRKRSYYFGISRPPFFGGVTGEAQFTVEADKNSWTVEVLTQEGALDFRFRLVCRKGRLLIDSFKQRYRTQDRSRTDRWQYGNF